MPLSFNTASRVSRQGRQDSIYYKITDTTHIAKVPMKRFLSYVNTKMEVTQFIARKTLERGHQSGKDVAVAWGNKGKSNPQRCGIQRCCYMLLQLRVSTLSPQTPTFYVFSLRRFPELCENTFYVTGRGQRHHKMAQISLNFLRHHYLRRRVEEVAAVLQEWVSKALNADDQLLDILLLRQP